MVPCGGMRMGGMLAIDELRRGFARVLTNLDKQPVVGRQGAGGIGARGIPGQRIGLTAAPAPVDLAPVARAAGFRHPTGPAKPLEGGGPVPDFGKAGFSYGRKIEARQRLRSVAWQNLAGWCLRRGSTEYCRGATVAR